MTKEETIRTMVDYVRRGVQSLESALAEAFEQGQIHPHWISVEEGLPNRLEVVICTNGHDVAEGFYEGNDSYGNTLWAAPCMGRTDVTHWLPFSILPKVSTKKQQDDEL